MVQKFRSASHRLDGRDPLGLLPFLTVSFFLLLAGCASAPPHDPVPEYLVEAASLPAYSKVRFWGDTTLPDQEAFLSANAEALRKRAVLLANQGKPYRTHYLALSGGGAEGAFGAGLLVGWTEAGTRPEFEVVSGVSTGALTAPFAFLGPEYDAQLKEAYTTVSTSSILRRNILAGILGGVALSDTAPFAKLIKDFTNQEMLEAIAREHRKGRRLFIGTTNLDAGRPVVWDIGALANSGNPDALGLFRRIIRASSAIPGLFPPVLFNVEAGGQNYGELHVDGGVTSQVFLYPARIDLRQLDARAGVQVDRRLYIIRNSKITPDYEVVKPGLFTISKRSIDTLIKNQGIGDLYRLHALTSRDGIEYNLAHVPASFQEVPREAFDQDYMRALFELGYGLAREDYSWLKGPPGIGDE